MTRAEVMRAMTNKANEVFRQKRVKEHIKYVEKLIGTKIYKKANKGFNCVKIKVSKHYSPILAIEQFESKGFSVCEARKNGKSILTIKW